MKKILTILLLTLFVTSCGQNRLPKGFNEDALVYKTFWTVLAVSGSSHYYLINDNCFKVSYDYMLMIKMHSNITRIAQSNCKF